MERWLPLLLVLTWPVLAAHALPTPSPPGELPFVALELPEPGRVDLVTQDSEGYLWVATHEELYRFDGRHFQRVPGGKEACLSGSRALVAGPEGAVWCLGADTLSRWRQGRWERPELPPRVGWPGQDLVLDGEGRAWLLTSHGLFRTRAGQDGFEPVPGWTGQMPRALWTDASGELYVTDLGVLHRRGADGQWRAWGAAEGLPREQLVGVARDGTGTLWVWSARSTWVLRPGASTFAPGPYLGNELLGGSTAVDARGTLWWAGSHGLFRQHGQEVLQVEGLPQGWLSHVFVDREGSVWVAGGAGLFRLAGRGLWQRHGQRQGLPSEVPWTLRRDEEGGLWAGTPRGLARGTASGWRLEAPLRDTPVRHLLPSPEGVLWLATGQEVWRYEPRTGDVVRLGREQGLADALVQALAWEPPSTLWVGTSAGLFRGTVSGRGARFVPVELSPNGELTPVSDLARDGRGRLWVASVRGLFVVEPDNLRRFTAAHGLRATWVRVLTTRRSGELCVAYENELGLSCFHPEGAALKGLRHLDRTSGLRGDAVHLLGEDARGRLWVGGERGVDVLGPGAFLPEASYTLADGLPGDDCAPGTFLAEPDGTVWVGTRSGLGQFLGSLEAGPAPPPATRLARLGEGDTLEPALPGLELSAETGPLELEVTALTFSGQHAVEHQWLLVGQQRDFQPLSGSRLRQAGLAPGPYELRVRSRLRHGAWGPTATLPFSVATPWWRSPFVAAAGLALLVLSGLLGSRLRQRALQRRNAELEALVSLRTAELSRTQERLLALEKLALEQRMAGGFAHEMRNALTGAKMLIGRASHGAQGTSLPADTSDKLMALYLQVRDVLPPELHPSVALLLRDINSQQEELDLVLRDVDAALGRGLAITRQILEYAQLGRHSPGQEPVALRKLVRAVLTESQEALTGVVLQVEVAEACTWRGRQDHVYSIVKNLVLNALDALRDKPGEGERRLRVAVHQDQERCVLQVEDTGVGIAPEHRVHLFEPFFSTKPDSGTGLGLAMVARLVTLYGGRIDVASEPGRGTTFTVALPHGAPPVTTAAG
ncbi:ATP-binding protein [Archangium sp.]|uniref:sensor histidine kinase n=1 Tax=Archangium sp. TaxID=1872627 RepID=UPI00286C3BFD|nr:ATP-binding protein [Archangium sp.]